MKTKIEVVTPELLERELTSPRFFDGLDRMIGISTNHRKLETLFEVEKELFGNGIAYPSQIEVGTQESVGGLVGNYHALELYQNSLKAAGKEVYPHTDDRFDTEDFTVFCMVNELSSVDYPEVPEEFSYKQSIDGVWYPLFKIHTHPTGRLEASVKDVKTPNSQRKHYKNHGVYVKPISIILGTHDRGEEKSYKLLFFQEKSEEPIPEAETLGSIDELHDFVNPTNSLAKLLLGMPGLENERFSKGIGYYDLARRSMSFDFDLNDFSYQMKARKGIK